MPSQRRELFLKLGLIKAILLLILLPQHVSSAGWITTGIYKVDKVTKMGDPTKAITDFITWIAGKGAQDVPSGMSVELSDTIVSVPLYYYKKDMTTLHSFFGTPATKGEIDNVFKTAGFAFTESAYDHQVCRYSDADLPIATAPDAPPLGTMDCPHTTTVELSLDSTVPIDIVKNVLCVTLEITDKKCSEITMSTPTLATVKNMDPIFVAVKLRGSLDQPSYLTALFVKELKVNNAVIYTRRPTPGTIISRGACSSRAWYLVFLVLLAPISYIVIKKGYRSGVTKGVKTALETHESEIALQKQILQQHTNMYQPVPIIGGDINPIMTMGMGGPNAVERNYWQEMQEQQYQNFYANQYYHPQSSMAMASPMSPGASLPLRT